MQVCIFCRAPLFDGTSAICRECGESDMHDGEDEFERDEYDGEPDFECRMLGDGTCLAAGSEDCDWECPHSRELYK